MLRWLLFDRLSQPIDHFVSLYQVHYARLFDSCPPAQIFRILMPKLFSGFWKLVHTKMQKIVRPAANGPGARMQPNDQCANRIGKVRGTGIR